MIARQIKCSLLIGLFLQVFCSGLQTIGQTRFGLSRLSIKHREYKGIGYDQGYTTLGMFLSGQSPEIPFGGFLDGRAHVFNDSSFASNVGMGFRFGDQEQKYLFGVNSYYDMRWMHGLESHQLGLGLEILTRHIDLRVNGYKPLVGTFADEEIAFENFKGHHVMLRQHVTYALPMAEAEIGATLPDPFDQVGLYLACGGYYLFKQKGLVNSSGDTPGGKVRLYAAPNPYITLGADYSYDKLFKSRVNGFIAFNVPLGRIVHDHSPKKKHTSWALIQGQDPVRQEIIPYYKEKHQFVQKSPLGDPVNVLFVDNSYDQIGNGTKETPFSSLSSAEKASKEGDLIYVFYGDGTSKGYSEGFTFKNKQKLLGSAASFDLYEIKIPSLTPEHYPLIFSNESTIKAFSVEDIEMQGLHVQSEENAAFVCSLSSGIFSKNSFEGGKNAPAIVVDSPVKQTIFSHNIIQGGAEDLKGSALVVIQGHQNFAKAFHHWHDNVFTCNVSSNGLMLDNVFDEILLQKNTFVSADPMGSAIVSKAASASDHLGLYTVYDNKVLTGFNEGITLHVTQEAYIKAEIHQNYLLSPTLTTAIAITHASPCSDIEILGNHLKATSSAIMIDTQAKESTLAIKDNEIYMFAKDPAVFVQHRGEGSLFFSSNTIEYAKSIKKAPEAFHLKLKGTSKLVIENNETHAIQMPTSCLVDVDMTTSKPCEMILRENNFSQENEDSSCVILTQDPGSIKLTTDQKVSYLPGP